jgi:lipoic acid synthetase
MVARAAQDMALRHVVVTSVTRDDLPDGGAAHFARTIQMIRQHRPDTQVEVLTPDFQGKHQNLSTVLEASPDVFNHNVETVPRLYPSVRPGAHYLRSLGLLAQAKERAPGILIKSGFMLGLGETLDEILEVLSDLKGAGCDIVTMGQYLRPSRKNIPVISYIRPETFESLRECALDMGFLHVASGPLVRSSMNADEIYRSAASRVS